MPESQHQTHRSPRPLTPLAPRIRNTVRQLYPIHPVQRPHTLQPIRVIHARVMRTVQYIHAHVLDGVVARETTRRRRIGEEVEQAEGSARAVELVAGVAGEVEAERLVVVENRRVDGAIEERENRVRRWRDYRVLNLLGFLVHK